MHTTLLLEMAADAAPERLALGRRRDELTYAETLRRVRAGAAWLADRKGAALAFVGLNGFAFPLALFAAGLLGRPFAPLNYRLPDADLRRLLERTAPSAAIVDDDMVSRLGLVEGVEILRRSDFEKACQLLIDGEPGDPDADRDIAIVLFTSGTTGEPKAALLRHANLTAYVISTVDFCSAGEDEASLVSVPPYHIAGVSAVLTGIYGGRRIVYIEAFSPELWVDAAAAEAITHAMVVPTMLGRILDCLQARGETLPMLKSLSYGGGRMPQPTIERAMGLLPNVDFINAYGLTETSSTIALLSPEDHRDALSSRDQAVRRRLGSVGRPLPTVEVEIRDAGGVRLPHNHAGEIYVRGQQVSGSYSHKTALDADGWFATNDGGWMDGDGYLFVEGRLDDVIVRGGENISPGEIEDVLRQHLDVADVAVIGLPDETWGERIACAVVPTGAAPIEAVLADWCRTRLRSTKTPEAWAFCDALPYNDTGKLLRRRLRAEWSSLTAAGGRRS